MVNTCRTCGLADLKQNKCRVNGSAIEPDKDFCSKHNKNPVVCERCGNITLQPIIVQDGNNWHIMCGNCSIGKLNTCAFCEHSSKCEFETNPSELPKLIQQQIRQGPMISVQTIKNPDRIRETCQILCDCFDAKFGCMRESNYCDKYKFIYDELNPVKEDAE